MSRQTNREKYIESAYQAYGPNGVIDFVPPSLGSAYNESIYAQAGFPGYQHPLGYQYPTQYPTQYVPSPYMGTQFPLASQPIQPILPTPLQEEAPNTSDLHERINAKIDSIISSQRASVQDQKADILGSQIERLTRKVQKLSVSMEDKRRLEDTFCRALSAKQGKENIEPLDDSDEEAQTVDARMRDNDIADRLRRLAAESRAAEQRGGSRLQDRLPEERRSRRVPDW